MAGAWFCSDKKHKQQIEECEARLNAVLAENAKLRDEIAQLRATNQQRPRVVMVGMGKDDDAGEFGYAMSDGGW